LRFCAVRTRLIVAQVVFFSLLLAASTQLYGQKTLGASVDVVGGLDSNPQLSFPLLGPTGQSSERTLFYGVYPAISLESRGARSVFNARYAFGWNRLDTELPTESKSHSAGVTFSTPIGARWNLDLEESYSMSDDLQTFYALRGVSLVGEDLVYVFAPTGARLTYRTNRASVSAKRAFSERSTLSFTGQHTLRGYDQAAAALTDQQSTTGSIAYARRLNERLSWSAEYSVTYHLFDDFNNALVNVVRAGLTNELARGTTVRFTIGPSFVTDPDASGKFTSYEATASLEQKVKENNFTLAFSQDNGNVTGLGSISKTRRATLGFNRALGRRVNVFADATGFDSTGILDNTIDTRGLSASANMGFSLTTKLSVQGGVSYQRYTRPSDFESSQKRVFASLRYSLPSLLRWR